MTKLIALVKPEGTENSREILRELDKVGTRIKTKDFPEVPEEIIKQQYSQHKERVGYEEMVDSYKGKPVVVAVYDGDIQKFKETKMKIREIYGSHIPTEKRERVNVLHTSENLEEATKEISLWEHLLE